MVGGRRRGSRCGSRRAGTSPRMWRAPGARRAGVLARGGPGDRDARVVAATRRRLQRGSAPHRGARRAATSRLRRRATCGSTSWGRSSSSAAGTGPEVLGIGDARSRGRRRSASCCSRCSSASGPGDRQHLLGGAVGAERRAATVPAGRLHRGDRRGGRSAIAAALREVAVPTFEVFLYGGFGVRSVVRRLRRRLGGTRVGEAAVFAAGAGVRWRCVCVPGRRVVASTGACRPARPGGGMPSSGCFSDGLGSASRCSTERSARVSRLRGGVRAGVLRCRGSRWSLERRLADRPAGRRPAPALRRLRRRGDDQEDHRGLSDALARVSVVAGSDRAVPIAASGPAAGRPAPRPRPPAPRRSRPTPDRRSGRAAAPPAGRSPADTAGRSRRGLRRAGPSAAKPTRSRMSRVFTWTSVRLSGRAGTVRHGPRVRLGAIPSRPRRTYRERSRCRGRLHVLHRIRRRG